MSKATKNLIHVIENRASHQDSWKEAENWLTQGADIKAKIKNISMIDSVIGEEKRYRPIVPWKADNCLKLIDILKKSASEQLNKLVLSQNTSSVYEMRQLVQLKADCYQIERFGPLGLLGVFLAQDKISIRLEVVQILVESDKTSHSCLTAIDTQQRTCLSLARTNPTCPTTVTEYLQQRFDLILNKIPIDQPDIDPNEVVAWIHRGANSEKTDEHGNTVLFNAIIANNSELVRLLVNAGANVSHKNNQGLTPLVIAKNAALKNPAIITFLEKEKVNDELRMRISSQKSNLAVDEVQSLLEHGANINAMGTNSDSILHHLIMNEGTPEMITTFVNDFNADISIINANGLRPIETCVLVDKHPYTRLIALLKLPNMTHDAFSNSTLKMTLIQFAQREKRPDAGEIIQSELNQRLCNCMVRINGQDENNKILLQEMKQLSIQGAQINQKLADNVYSGGTGLHLACKTATKLLIQYMIEELKADYMLANDNGDYPISIASEFGKLAIVEYLKTLPNSNLNVSNKTEQTPLHLATQNHHFLIARYLVRWGADPRALDTLKQTPLDIARANKAKNKEDEINDRKLVKFFEQLTVPMISDATKKKTDNFIQDPDICELVAPIHIKSVSMRMTDEEQLFGSRSLGLLRDTPNDTLLGAAKSGNIVGAQKAIGEGADIRSLKNGLTPYEIATSSMQSCGIQLNSPMVVLEKRQELQVRYSGCQEILRIIHAIAKEKMLVAIEKSDVGLVKAYHRAGAPITPYLLYKTSETSDNVEIVDYLVNQNKDMYEALINYTTPESFYKNAKTKKFDKLAAYFKYRLSLECSKAIKENNFQLANKLVHDGANVEMHDTNNMNIALKNQNPAMVELLCKNGAKLPVDWLKSNTITLDPEIAQQLTPEIRSHINRSLVNRRLRLAAANGDLEMVVRCQRLGADIDSVNYDGATALLCAIKGGNYFSVVQTLIVCGASMLHSNQNEMSLIDLARQKNYTEIHDYLSKELNVQFLSAILNNDRHSAESYARMGADFNYQDEQNRTPLHYAVQYHEIDLVSWLCECGSEPTVADINGDYPLIQATEKGNYAVVELFITKYPATKKQTNKAGQTALQIAQNLKFSRIVELIKTGKSSSEPLTETDIETNQPKHDYGKLREACIKGDIQIIREFIQEPYESIAIKKKICSQLIDIAKRKKQLEILDILKAHYREINAEPQWIGDQRDVVRLSEHYRKILNGFLSGLSIAIAESPIVLDPTDPNTYKNLFTDLNNSVEKRFETIKTVTDEKDAKQLIDQDSVKTQQRLTEINAKLEELLESRESIQEHIEDIDERLFKQQTLSAIEKKELMKFRDDQKKQLTAYDCSAFLSQRQRDSIFNRQKMLDFLKKSSNLSIFYRTIENRLEALFHSALLSQSGYLKMGKVSKFDTPGLSNDVSTRIPFANVLIASVKAIIGPILSKLDEKVQKQEWYNISILGNIEELNRIASETAGLLTLYYEEQIQLIDPFAKIKRSNVFNNKLKWIQEVFYRDDSETSDGLPVIMVAEYVTAWVIDALKTGKKTLTSNAPLPIQLWLHVAKKNPISYEKTNQVTDIIETSVANEKIPLKIKNILETKTLNIRLSYLIGFVSVVGNDGNIYQCQLTQEKIDKYHDIIDKLGCVYLTPFTSDEQDLQAVVEGRKLELVRRDTSGNFLTKIEELTAYTQAYVTSNDEYYDKSSIIKQTTDQMVQILRERKIFMDANDIKDHLEKLQENVELTVDTLREDITRKTDLYQTSIDAAHEQIKEESKINRETMERDNQTHYAKILKRLHEQVTDMEEKMKQRIETRLDDGERKNNEKIQNILTIVEEAKAQSFSAITQAKQAIEISESLAKQTRKLAQSCENMLQVTEQRNNEFHSLAQSCELKVTQTTAKQQEIYEKTTLEIRKRIEVKFESAKISASESATNAKESSRAARESASTAKDLQKLMKDQFDFQKKEDRKLLEEVNEIKSQSEKTLNEAREIQKQAKKTADTSTESLEKLHQMQKELEKALDEMNKLKRKYASKQE